MKKQKEGDYITYKSGENFHASGIVEKVLEKEGRTVYIVAEGNGGARLTEVDSNDVLTLIQE